MKWTKILLTICLFLSAFGTTVFISQHLTPQLEEAKSVKELKIETDDTDRNRTEKIPELLPNDHLNPGSIHPILNEAGFIIGGSSDGIWVTPEKFLPYLKDGEIFKIYSRTSYLGESAGQAVIEKDFPTGTKGYRVIFKQNPAKPGEAIFAIHGGWNPFPRPIHYVPVEPKVTQKYIPIITKALAKIGIEDPKANIKELILVDLDGDDRNEALLVASNFVQSEYQKLDQKNFENAQSIYSLVILCKEVDGQEETTIILGSYQELTEYEILVVADFDGDWEMELLIRAIDWNASEPDNAPLFEDILIKINENKPQIIFNFSWYRDFIHKSKTLTL